MNSRDQKKELLLDAAVAIYARQGDFTARELAAESGMNIASLNYYFGSKENLMDMIEQQLIDIFVEEITLAGDSDAPVADRLYLLLLQVSRRLGNNPGLARHFVEMLIAGEKKIYNLLANTLGVDSPAYNVFAGMMDEAGIKDKDDIWHRLVIGISSLAPSLISGLGNNTSVAETRTLRQEDFLEKHIRTLTKMLLVK